MIQPLATIGQIDVARNVAAIPDLLGQRGHKNLTLRFLPRENRDLALPNRQTVAEK